MKTKLCKNCKAILKHSSLTYCSYQCRDNAKIARAKKAKWLKQRGVTKTKLDKLWSQKVKERDQRCVYCGKQDYLNAHHIYSRSNHAIRWDIDNGITLCSGHHTFSSAFSAHKTPLEFVEWITERLGADHIQSLKDKAREKNPKTFDEWWEELNC